MLKKLLCNSPADHYWRPIKVNNVPPEKWFWGCTKCSFKTLQIKYSVPGISLKDLERMVDDSLRIADNVIEDNQSLRGELWLMRNAIWEYWPYRFQILYHVYHGDAFIMMFSWKCHEWSNDEEWASISTTKDYRTLLNRADICRRAQP